MVDRHPGAGQLVETGTPMLGPRDRSPDHRFPGRCPFRWFRWTVRTTLTTGRGCCPQRAYGRSDHPSKPAPVQFHRSPRRSRRRARPPALRKRPGPQLGEEHIVLEMVLVVVGRARCQAELRVDAIAVPAAQPRVQDLRSHPFDRHRTGGEALPCAYDAALGRRR